MEEVCISISKGESITWTLSFTDDDHTPIDITGYTIIFCAKEKIDDLDSAAKIRKVITSHTNPTVGETQVVLTSSDTSIEGNLLFDIWAKNTLNQPKKVINGILSIKKAISQTFS